MQASTSSNVETQDIPSELILLSAHFFHDILHWMEEMLLLSHTDT